MAREGNYLKRNQIKLIGKIQYKEPRGILQLAFTVFTMEFTIWNMY